MIFDARAIKEKHIEARYELARREKTLDQDRRAQERVEFESEAEEMESSRRMGLPNWIDVGQLTLQILFDVAHRHLLPYR